MALTLSDATRAELVASIQRFFLAERGDAIGELQASFFLDFVLQEVAPAAYNQGVRDAQTYVQRVVADLDATLVETEQAYTAAQRTRRR